jgi:hypothetical protein
MGIDTEAARFLLSISTSGVSFRRCVTLGRQGYFLTNRESARLLREFAFDPGKFPNLFKGTVGERYSEPFWHALGVEELHTIDASHYEGATIVHDMNQPIPARLKGQFDVVCDAGTIEHIFNFPTAITNCLEMVKTGGHFIAHTTANNCFGHGFYQFSPELFYRTLSPQNGFTVRRMVAVEYGPSRRWYEVADPAAVRSRVTLINHCPVLLFILATKVSDVPVLTHHPQQSDYVAVWDRASGDTHPDPARTPRLTRFAKTLLERSATVGRLLEALYTSSFNRRYSFRNRTFFTRVAK